MPANRTLEGREPASLQPAARPRAQAPSSPSARTTAPSARPTCVAITRGRPIGPMTAGIARRGRPECPPPWLASPELTPQNRSGASCACWEMGDLTPNGRPRTAGFAAIWRLHPYRKQNTVVVLAARQHFAFALTFLVAFHGLLFVFATAYFLITTGSPEVHRIGLFVVAFFAALSGYVPIFLVTYLVCIRKHSWPSRTVLSVGVFLSAYVLLSLVIGENPVETVVAGSTTQFAMLALGVVAVVAADLIASAIVLRR